MVNSRTTDSRRLQHSIEVLEEQEFDKDGSTKHVTRIKGFLTLIFRQISGSGEILQNPDRLTSHTHTYNPFYPQHN